MEEKNRKKASFSKLKLLYNKSKAEVGDFNIKHILLKDNAKVRDVWVWIIKAVGCILLLMVKCYGRVPKQRYGFVHFRVGECFRWDQNPYLNKTCL